MYQNGALDLSPTIVSNVTTVTSALAPQLPEGLGACCLSQRPMAMSTEKKRLVIEVVRTSPLTALGGPLGWYGSHPTLLRRHPVERATSRGRFREDRPQEGLGAPRIARRAMGKGK